MPPIHIVHIIPTLRFGGAERFVVNLVNASDREIFRHTILVLSDDTPLAADMRPGAADIVIVKKRGRISPGLIGALQKMLKEKGADIVHTHLSGGDIWGRMAAARLGIPVVTTLHNMNMDEGFFLRSAKRILAKKTDQYTACSRAVQAWSARAYGIPASDIAPIHYGIPMERFSGVPGLAPRTHDPLRLLFIGRLVPQKGADILLSALSQVDPSLWRLTLAGDGPLRVPLQKMYGAGGVVWAGETHDIQGLLSAHDALIVPSRWEGLGIVVMEAMAAGRLVVASNTGGIPELVQDKKTGVLVRAGDVFAWKESLNILCREWQAYLPIAASGREYAATHFGVLDMAERYAEIYRKVCDRPTRV